MHISNADNLILSALKLELQRINDLSLKVDPKVIEYIKGRINSIESPPPETERPLLSYLLGEVRKDGARY